VLGGGGAKGAAQVGVLLALFEAGVEPPARLVGVSVGALNAAVLAGSPTLAGVEMLREVWLSKLARDVFRVHPLGIMLSRLRGEVLTTLPGSNVERLIQHHLRLTGMETFEQLRVPLQVVATDITAGRPRIFSRGPLLPALRASTAIPGVFPAVHLDGSDYLDGGIVHNLPLTIPVEEGEKEVVAIDLMAGSELERPPRTWGELMARTLQLTLHQRALTDFELVRRRARVVVLSPLLALDDGLDMRREHVLDLIERARAAMRRLLQERGRRLFRRSGIHYLPLAASGRRQQPSVA
jgi:NTE family protein